MQKLRKKPMSTSPQAQNETLSSNRPTRIFRLGFTSTTAKGDRTKSVFLEIIDQYFKLTPAIPTSKTISVHTENLFLDHCINPFGIPTYLLTDNGPQFVSKLFSSIRGYIGLKHPITTTYHSQTNGQAERYYRTIVTRISTVRNKQSEKLGHVCTTIDICVEYTEAQKH